jgi:outer membrane protein TolC
LLQQTLASALPERDKQNVHDGIWQQSALLVAALQFNPALAEARGRIREATSGVQSAKAAPNVTVGLGGEYNLTQTVESPWLWSISTDFLLDAVLRKKLRTQLAEASVRAVRLDYAESIWTVRRELRAALVTAVLTEQRVTLLMQSVQQNQQLARMIQRRIDSGEASGKERLQLALELTRSQSALANAERDRNDARALVAAKIGVPVSALTGRQLALVELDLPASFDEQKIQTLRQQALLSRSDLERAVADYQAREIELEQQVRLQYPQFSIGPGYMWDHGVRKATLGLSFSLPLFSGNRGPIAEAEARRSSAGEHLLGVQGQIFNEIDVAMIAYRSALDVLQTARSQSQMGQSLVTAAEHGVRAGTDDTPTLLATQLVANAYALAELDAMERVQQTLGQLEDTLRTPLVGSETQLRLQLDPP